MTEIRYITGDATNPLDHGHQIIAHVCNDVGKFGAGFAAALANRYPISQGGYLFRHLKVPWQIGECQAISIPYGPTIVNMIAQHGVRSAKNPNPIRYEALESCLNSLARFAIANNASVHMPRIGCGLAGGTWPEVEPIIQRTLCAADVPVTVYDLPS